LRFALFRDRQHLSCEGQVRASRGRNADATSHRGFFYHFLDLKSGERTWESELSTIDTGLLLMGLFTAAEYFRGDNALEREIRDNVDEIWRRVSDGRHYIGWISDYNFAINQGPLVMMVENFRTSLLWRLMRDCRWIKQGLKRAGFKRGWLGTDNESNETACTPDGSPLARP
jgi:hypothetical protein